MKIYIKKLSCKRCSYEWVPRIISVKVCPKCKSPYWDKERTLMYDAIKKYGKKKTMEMIKQSAESSSKIED